jgi:zinc/manganese transport system substrate-binding protein
VEVDSFLDGTEDPHFVDAVPSFITKAARADVVCSVGLDLEIGWLPRVLAKSGNAKVQRTGAGSCEFGRSVSVLEKPSGPLDRSMGDVHAGGNPHFYLSPSKLAESAGEVLRVLKRTDPANAHTFAANAKSFEVRMFALKQKLSARLAPLRGKLLIQFHKEFTYFFSEYGLMDGGAIEEKPGVPPSSVRIAQVSKEAKVRGVVLAVGAHHTPTKHLQKLSEVSGVPYVKLPSGVLKRDPSLDSIEKLQMRLADGLLRGAKVSIP